MRKLLSGFLSELLRSAHNCIKTKNVFLVVTGCLISLVGSAQIPSWQIVQAYGSADTDEGKIIAEDGNGNVYLGGVFSSASITFGSTTLTNAGYNGQNTDVFLVKYNSSGTLLWAISFGSTMSESIIGMTTDVSGSVYITGSYGGTLAIGSTTLSNSGAYIAKYSPTGTPLQATGIQGAAFGHDLAVDGTGNLFITGRFSSSISIGSTTLTSQGLNDIFTAKYSSTGAPLWAVSSGSSGIDYGNEIAVDANGDVVVAGYFTSSSVSFGTINLTNPGTNTQQLFLVKYSLFGTPAWAISVGGPFNEQPHDMVLDATGNIYVAGLFGSASLTLGSSTIINNHPGSSDVLIAKFSPTGTPLWAAAGNGNSSGLNDVGFGITMDAGGNVIVAGFFDSQSITFGSNTLTDAGLVAGFLVSYTNTGTLNWALPICGNNPTTSAVHLTDVVADNNGTLFATGYIQGSVNFGASTLTALGSRSVVFGKLIPGCSAAPSQPVSITGASSACSGSSQIYSVTAVTGATSYNWTLPTGWTGTSSTNSITVTAGAAGGNITVAASNACGTSAAQTLAVTVTPGLNATITAAGATTFCQGGSVSLNASTGTGYTYQWQLNGNNIAGATSGSYTATAGGSYTVSVSSGSCSSTSTATIVTVNALPSPTITQTGFTLSTTSGQGSYQWYKNAAIIAGATTNSYTVTQNGTYYVVVTNSSNCTGQSNSINITNVSAKGPKKKELNVYPTASEGRFIIQLPNGKMPQRVTVFGVDGKLVEKKVVEQGHYQLRLSLDTSPGLYYVQLIYPDELYFSRVIVR